MFKWILVCLAFIGTLYARPDQRTLDVVIIGAGISGTYTGWKLVENGKSDVHIFEGSNRIGGRIHTLFFDEMPQIPVELGAAHFLASDKRVKALVDHFNLPITPITQVEPNNIRFLRGKRILVSEGFDHLPYNLPLHEKGKSPHELINLALSRIDPKLSLQTWSEKKESLPMLNEMSWQSFLLKHLSSEAFQLLADLQEMQLVADVSVNTALSHIVSQSTEQAFAIETGNDQLPKKLADAFEKSGGKIYLKHHLMSVSYEGDNENFRYRLLFYEKDGSFKPVYAKHLIFTITPPALKLLADQAPAFKNDQFKANLEAFVSIPATKIFLGYEKPWWTQMGITGGQSITTLPITRCIYGEKAKDDEKALLCASYSNLYDAFWESFSAGDFFANDLGQNALWQAEKQLQIIHGTSDLPKAFTGTFVDWSDAPDFGAFFFWKTKGNAADLTNYFQHPFFGEPLYIIGSAYSEHQGTVEGALESADALLKNYFFIGNFEPN